MHPPLTFQPLIQLLPRSEPQPFALLTFLPLIQPQPRLVPQLPEQSMSP
jgi:hypothetical protein